MRLKIRCDEESWKVFEFWVEVNKGLKTTQNRPCLVPKTEKFSEL